MTRTVLLSAGVLVAVLALPAGAFGRTPDPFICMYGHSDDAGVTDAFRKIIPPFNVIEGTSTDAAFIKELRTRGAVYAAHVTNPETAAAQELLAVWRAPFENNLGGRLPGGYDAIAIDELRANPHGSVQSQRVCDALGQLRALYPNKGIFAAAVWQLGYESAKYSQQLRAVNQHADMLMLEAYLRETKQAYGYFASWADNLKAVAPGILRKTVYGLGISQRGHVFDDTAEVGFWGHLDQQFRSIRTDADASTMPGVMFWVYYRCETDLTPDYLARLIDHYYIRKRTDYLGDGTTRQLITNSRFDTPAGWTPAPGKGGAVDYFAYDSAGIENDHGEYGWSSHGARGLKMLRGRTPNRASFRVTGVDPNWVYTVSAWVTAKASGQGATLIITTPDGTPVARKQIEDVRSGAQWNEWSRIVFHFAPPSNTVHVVLSDQPAAPGATLYWDFVELEKAYRAAAR